MVNGIALGAPNIYQASDELRRTLGAERMDVCAFVGVAPRGPCRIPVEPDACKLDQIYLEPSWKRQRSVAIAISSWDEYQRLYGSFEGPGKLPYAVAAFFEQGGQQAYIVRIVHDYQSAEDLQGVAQGNVGNLLSSGGGVNFVAKNEGAWGNKLRVGLGFTAAPLVLLQSTTTTELRLSEHENHGIGTLLRLTIPGAGSAPSFTFRFVTQQGRRGKIDGNEYECFLQLNAAVDEIPIAAEVIEGDLLLEDGNGFQEHFNHLGLVAEHPRWLAKVLYRESDLVNPEIGWVDSSLMPIDAYSIPLDPKRMLIDQPVLFTGGQDRYQVIEPSDFFDNGWVLGNPRPGGGVHCLTHLPDLASVVVPDLYVPEPLHQAVEDEPIKSFASAEFSPCVDLEIVDDTLDQLLPSLPGLLLDPKNSQDLQLIIFWQGLLVDLADQLKQFVILLDVPPGLSQTNILAWRSHFQSSFVAAYYPWLTISNLNDGRDALIKVNPAAVAAGIIARQELTFGVPHGPANVIAAQVIKVDEKISPQRHDQLHPQGINVFLQQRDGVWLSAGRTLSRDQHYRQLSVRRLMTMLQRVLARQMFWVVFEPNNASLWSEIRHLLDSFLRQLFIAGAFKGNNEQEAFFVRCDSELNHSRVRDAGQLIVEIGVAPAEPLEFILVKIVRGSDGTLAVQS